MMRIFKMYFLAIFQIYNTVFTIVTMLYISSPIHFIIQIYTFWLPLPAPNPPLLATTIYSASLNLLFLNITHINEIICYFSFSVWFISLSIMPSRSIHVVETGKIFFFLWVDISLYYIFFIHSSVKTYIVWLIYIAIKY